MSDLSQQLDKIASDRGANGKHSALLALAALVLLNKDNDVIFDADDLRTTGNRLRAASLAPSIVDLEGSGDALNSHASQGTIGYGSGVANNALLFTAVAFGSAGNRFSIEFVDPGDINIALSFVVAGEAITVTLATDGDGVITTTAGDIVTLLAGSDLVTVINTGGSDGTGLVGVLAAQSIAEFGTPGLDEVSTGAGVAGTGSRYTDTTGGNLWINQGTKAVPDWHQLATV